MTEAALAKQPLPLDPSAPQRAASDPASSVWVNASAGSGKTKILTDRVVRLLLDGVSPHKILCLTFTRAATADMSIKVNQRLSQWAVCGDNELNASLSDLQGYAPTPQQMTRARRLFAATLSCPGGMRIRTLHAFGQEILRRFPIESGLPPHFAVIEENDALALQEDILTDLLRDAGREPDNAVSRALATLIDTLGETNFRDALRQALREQPRITRALQTHRTLDEMILRMRTELNLEPGETEARLHAEAFEPPQFKEDRIAALARMFLEGTKTQVACGEGMLRWLEQNNERRAASFNQYVSLFLTDKGEARKQIVKGNLAKKYPELEPEFTREATRLLSIAERCASVAIAETTAAMLVVGAAFHQRYAAQKRLRAALDYDDLVNQTLSLLRRPGIAPWILHKLDEGLDHLLVDEAQDTSRAQWDMVATLADEFFAGTGARDTTRTLFVVGDEKQSIYSFQNADPEAFADMRDYFSTRIKEAEQALQHIPLRVSFRSAPAVLRAVDAVFASEAAAAGVSSSLVEHISHKRGTLFGRVEVWPLIPQPEKETEQGVWDMPVGYQTETDPQAELAQRMASMIKGWMARGEKLPGSDRPIQPGDIMILLRRRGRFADLMVRALKQDPQVPVTGVDRMHLLKQLPVMDLLALINFVLLPEDDLNLAALLRGPLLNLSENDLMMLAAKRGDKTLWHSLKDKQNRHQIIHDYLATWLGHADFMTPFAMLTQILSRPCPANAVSGRKAIWSRLGVDAIDPIDELLNAAQNFSRRHAPSLQNFLHWLKVSDSEIKRELDSGSGQVRIMTVHASKGLEAPIVFLPDTTNMPQAQKMPKFQWNEKLELPFYIARKPDAGALRGLWNGTREKQLQEYRRLLYVALTRASHRLYIGGWELPKKEPDSDGNWHNLVINGLKHSEAHATPGGDGVLVWEDVAKTAPAIKAPAQAAAKIIPLPAWAFEAAPAEKAEAQPLSPSKLAAAPSVATPDRAFARGRVIHRLLQSLPDVEDAKRDAIAARFLAHPQYGLSAAEQKDISDEVLQLLRDKNFAVLFGGTSRAEVPLAGSIAGRKVTGQVDRLALLDDEVWIVDYKTNRPPPRDTSDIPETYRAQMEAYRAILTDIYPQHKIRCFLLWTYGPIFMEVLN